MKIACEAAWIGDIQRYVWGFDIGQRLTLLKHGRKRRFQIKDIVM